MRVRCIHGYFIFEETKVGQISDFMTLTGLDLVAVDEYYTFESIAEAPDFSLAGLSILGTPAIQTFEGRPWEVFLENEIVYHFGLDLVVPIASITQKIKIEIAGNLMLANGLILPGSIADQGQVSGYDAWFSRDTQVFKYSEVTYV